VSAERVVRAGGGVPARGTDGTLEVLVVHRPAYDDWTFPKGKAETREREEDAALREVREETGLRCALLDELPSTTYRDPLDRPKRVRYWRMAVLAGALTPNEEVDELEWVSVPGAAARLSYPHDLALLRALASRSLVVRHARAGDRRAWRGDDGLRPLDGKGRRQARALAETLTPFSVSRVLSSPALRCVQTVQPLAEALGLAVEPRDELAEGAEAGPARALLAREPGGSVLCTHGDVGSLLCGEWLRKGAAAVVSFEAGFPRLHAVLPPGAVGPG
jgi:8-oxo-dGTP pyrophosphatase MutT (NUDIX family)/phosphohistidine phosphatase SixA